MVKRTMKPAAWLLALVLAVVAVTLSACGKSTKAAEDTASIFEDPKTAQLAEAGRAGDAASVTKLVASGADASGTGARGISVLEWSMLQGNTEGFVALLDAGADTKHTNANGDSIVHRASEISNAAFLAILILRHADLNAVNPLTGATPLMAALSLKRKTQAHALLVAKADVNAANHSGDTALHLAGETNDGAICVELLNAGADPSARNKQGATFQTYLYAPLDDSLNEEARAGRNAVTEWLTQHGIPLETVRAQQTP